LIFTIYLLADFKVSLSTYIGYLHFNSHFPAELRLTGSRQLFPPHLLEYNLWE